MITFFSAVKRKLGFLDKAGYNIFGNNKYFVPRIKLEALFGVVNNINKAVNRYEKDMGNTMSSIIQGTSQNLKEKQVCNSKTESSRTSSIN